MEETADISETGKFTCNLAQVVAKSFNCILRVQILPDTATREWKRRAATDKTWARFKTHFSREIRDYQKDQVLTDKLMCISVNAANQ